MEEGGTWNAIELFKKQNFETNYVIGLHLREEYLRTRPQPLAVEIFFKCALQATPSHLRNTTKYFVATDNSGYVSVGESILGKNNIIRRK